ncbi:hypothetical protein ACH5RR_031750 [Cinchona calisaya]|uniref:F-box domain-containing protein n=1 Tax=Cinchona calisaya TaxID=153742 RepID=A0ABD2YG46_9GENT
MEQQSHELPHIPHDLVVEIFTRLPVKSLLKFKCVSKSWLALISTPHFIKNHLKKSSQNQDFNHHRLIAPCAAPHYTPKLCSLQSLIQEPITCAAEIDIPVKSTPTSSVSVVGSCNGLVCIVVDCIEVFLWNPSTRKSKKVIDSGFVRRQHCYTIYGFGYNETNDDYNVVTIFRALNDVKIESKIYSLNNDNWRRIEDFPGFLPCYSWGKYVNGKLHWPGYSGKHDRAVVSLDLEKAKYGELKLPISGDVGSNPVVGVLRKCLCVIYEDQRSNVDLWVMKEYGVKDSWVKILSFPSLGVRGHVPLCVSREGEVLLQIGSIFKLHNLQNDSMMYPKIMNMDNCSDGTIYVEGLVSVKANDEEVQRQHG